MIVDSEEIETSPLLRLDLLRYCALLGSGPGAGEWWSWEDSLIKLAIQEGTLELNEVKELSTGAKTMIEAHLGTPNRQRAPARFLALIHTWKHLRDNWYKEIKEKLQSLEAGIGKLREAGEQVAKLEDEVSRQRQQLEVRTIKFFYLYICMYIEFAVPFLIMLIQALSTLFHLRRKVMEKYQTSCP